MARILLAEDYDDLRDMVTELLKQQGHDVEAFDNGLDVHEILKSRSFDLVILDWELPQKLGIEICREYRQTGGTTPVLLVTGKKAPSDKEAGFEAGADDYLTKPFHPKEFLARIRALLRRASLASSTSLSLGELEPGSVFAERYEIVAPLGRGSSGVIYKANHVFLNRFVAVKVLHPQLVAEPESVARFRREAQAVSCLSHPNIIAIYDFGITPAGLPYLVMDFTEGETLAQKIQRTGRLNADQALPIFIQACEGLAHSHARGIIHRDVKPGNLMLSTGEDGNETLKVLDFGIAKIPHGAASLQVTQNGDVLGSPLYMSPEQCMGQELDMRTDIYSLGCVMYASLLGREPFVGDNVLDTMYRRTVEDASPFSAVRTDIEYPQAIETIVLKALHRDRDKRYQTMDELRADLQELACVFLT